MNILEIIQKKRDKNVLTRSEIAFFMKGYTKGEQQRSLWQFI